MTSIAAIIKADSGLLDRPHAAAYLGVTPRTLAVWACTGRYNLPYVKVGRKVKYRRIDLDAWLTERTVGRGRVVKEGEVRDGT